MTIARQRFSKQRLKVGIATNRCGSPLPETGSRARVFAAKDWHTFPRQLILKKAHSSDNERIRVEPFEMVTYIRAAWKLHKSRNSFVREFSVWALTHHSGREELVVQRGMERVVDSNWLCVVVTDCNCEEVPMNPIIISSTHCYSLRKPRLRDNMQTVGWLLNCLGTQTQITDKFAPNSKIDITAILLLMARRK
jgi:hypothetical protein